MRLHAVEAEMFLSFGERVRLELGAGLTVVTGPNGAGKTNLGLAVDLARAVIDRASGDADAERLDRYRSAGHDDAGSFWVALELEFDQEWERTRIWAFVCAGYACAVRGQPGEPAADEADAYCRRVLQRETVMPLFSGRLLVRCESAQVRPWFAAWEFGHGGETWHVVLDGEGDGQLRRGRADLPSPSAGSGSMRDWLLGGKPQAEAELDFGLALENMTQPVSFSVQSVSLGSAPVPASLREMAPSLNVAEYGNRMFSFGYLLSSLLRRGLVLTDNLRLPIRTRFGYDELREPAELRDGASVAAVLYALKNGGAEEQERFRRVQAAFEDLTGRSVEVRVRYPAEGAGVIVEPVVAGDRGQRPVEFSGAGVQGALFLATLLAAAPGQVIVLDEPAVNLEPTVQRRALRQFRGGWSVPGHYPSRGSGAGRRSLRLAPGGARRPGLVRGSRAAARPAGAGRRAVAAAAADAGARARAGPAVRRRGDLVRGRD